MIQMLILRVKQSGCPFANLCFVASVDDRESAVSFFSSGSYANHEKKQKSQLAVIFAKVRICYECEHRRSFTEY